MKKKALKMTRNSELMVLTDALVTLVTVPSLKLITRVCILKMHQALSCLHYTFMSI